MHESSQFLQNEFHALNPEQLQAVHHKTGPALVLAGAGSGKTRVVASRIGALIADGVPPESIVGVTFTNKAAGEMKERVERFVGKNVLISTFHSLGALILRQTIDRLGYSRNFVIYDTEDTEKLLKALMKELFGGMAPFEVKEARAFITEAKNGLSRLADSDLDRLYTLYMERLKAFNALDFDDLLFLPVTLFASHPDILASFQAKWTHLLVDEYQDTNMAQYTLTRHLVEKSKNLFVVGDPDQSIYSWRGANIQNILNFERDYPGAAVFRLEQNYRSTETILSAANAVIQNNARRYEKNLWSTSIEGEKISIYGGASEGDEAQFVAKTVEHLHSNENIPLDEMVIFYRTNFQSRSFEDALIRKKIPYTIIGGLSFYQRKEIKDILSFLRLLEHPQDFISFLRVINTPKRGFGEQFLSKIIAIAKKSGRSVLELFTTCEEPPCHLSPKQKEGWLDFARIMKRLEEIKASQTLPELVRAAITETGYLSVIDADPETRQDRRENLSELIAKAAEWEEVHSQSSLAAFLEEITLATSTDYMDSSSSRLSLMTVHNGKGLEFQVVFLVGMEEDLFPHINSKDSEDKIEEERRLFYVGLTRAKRRLFISSVSYRHLWGGARHMRPSRFLFEIPFELRKRISHPPSLDGMH